MESNVFTKPAIGLVFVLCSLIGAKAQETASISETSKTEDGVYTYRWQNSSATTDFKIEARGTIEVTDDDKDIKRISDDGYLEISKTVFGSKRAVRIEGLGNGQIQREYFEGRTKMPWAPNGKEWLAEILPEVVRSSTLGAEARVQRFFNKGGTNAVLSEIDRIESDHVKNHYGNLLMKQAVQPRDYPSIIERVTDKMNSDHYVADFLQKNIQKFLQSTAATTAVFSATRRMDSDHYKAGVLSQALQGTMATQEAITMALQSAADMESDHYVTEVLTNLLKQGNLSPQTITALINTTRSIESDHYRTIVLKQALARKDLTDAAHRQLLGSVKEMSSDHYITEVMVSLMGSKLSDESMNDVFNLLPAVESDHYRTEIFRKILQNQQVTEGQVEALLAACADMESDHYKTEVLKEAIARAKSTGAVIKILQSLSQIESDHYLTEVLTSVAPRVKGGSNELKEAYRQAAHNISSEHYYGQTLRAIEE